MFVAYNFEGENKGPGFNLKGFVDDNSCPTTITQVYAFFVHQNHVEFPPTNEQWSKPTSNIPLNPGWLTVILTIAC